MTLDLTGKTALIGGSTQGIGLASAQAMAEMGARCVLISRNRAKLEAAVKTLDASGGQQHGFLVADYADTDMVRETVAAFITANTVHILVNNSGGPAGGPASKAKPEEFLAAFNQHLICNHIITLLVAEGMKR